MAQVCEILPRYNNSFILHGPCHRCWFLVHNNHGSVLGIRRGSEIDLSQTRHETAFSWRRNGPMMSQSTGLIQWPIYPWHLIEIYGHIDTCNKVFMTPICRTSTPVQLWLIYSILVRLQSWWMAYTIWNHNKTVTLRRHKGTYNSASLPYLDEDGGTTATHWLKRCFYVEMCFLSMELRLETFYLPFVAGIDPPHQGVVDSYYPLLSSLPLYDLLCLQKEYFYLQIPFSSMDICASYNMRYFRCPYTNRPHCSRKYALYINGWF